MPKIPTPFPGAGEMTEELTTHAEKLAEAVRSPKFSHVRARRWCGENQAHIYHFDPASPSGFFLAATGTDEEVSMVLIACGKSAAISPTEPR